jgi:hypothetical protein
MKHVTMLYFSGVLSFGLMVWETLMDEWWSWRGNVQRSTKLYFLDVDFTVPQIRLSPWNQKLFRQPGLNGE